MLFLSIKTQGHYNVNLFLKNLRKFSVFFKDCKQLSDKHA